jgi:predicted small secreted protein
MKRAVLVLSVAAICAALLAGRNDIRRFREMRSQ